MLLTSDIIVMGLGNCSNTNGIDSSLSLYPQRERSSAPAERVKPDGAEIASSPSDSFAQWVINRFPPFTKIPQKRFIMAQWHKVSWAIASLLAGVSAGCQSVPPESAATSSPVPVVTPSPAASTPAAKPTVNLYQRGLDRGGSAATLTQIAQSRDDWRLVATRWQQAIDQLQAVPASHPDHSKAQQKIREYQRNLAIAQARSVRPNPPVTPTNLAEALGNSAPNPRRSAPAPVAQPAASAPVPARNSAPIPSAEGTGFRVPIVRRAGGTPIINVTFNGSTAFPMILDTGASGTVITREMAQHLQVRAVGQAQVSTASASNVSFPLGYVNSIQVGDAVAQNVLVAIAGPNLTYGLLGQDFFQAFDVTIREQEVEFHPR
ncbi:MULTISPECIES: retropepsin-like aspartic protease [unclassified Leptolyngbya]|uniref:retropepsin-like aspartic protease family protein n=1 Tax=unclassified Leptolyngbya TaxID=2650499 RepID=UPI0016847CB3|nr:MULTISPECIES: retropepsin-like aspartic protease [unclassified Leptolyngbya]MBD1910690.1 retroviral-like aspartic protease family protein [Leptolyngbya sp. FACHB-8]MBD2154287.1 retroviral-like aspartic protease family protein [Leptolyngbya sp. FACHB-16]